MPVTALLEVSEELRKTHRVQYVLLLDTALAGDRNTPFHKIKLGN